MELSIEGLQDKMRVLERSSHESRRRIEALSSENSRLQAELTENSAQLAETSNELEKYFTVRGTL
jgi:hypothetical protein